LRLPGVAVLWLEHLQRKEIEMTSVMKRRRFVGGGVAAAAAIAWDNPLFAGEAAAAEPKKDGLPWDVVAVRNGGPVEMFEAGIAAMGGMKAFVRPGQSVLVKPNIAWDQPPEIPANTNPALVGAIVRHCLAAGAKRVLVLDHTCHNWQRAYETSGISKAVTDAGGVMGHANQERHYREVELPKARRLKTTLYHGEVLDTDVFINVPILKHHGGARLTMCMKNLMGVVWDRRWFHANNLDQCIADLCFAPRVPDLNILDAFRILRRNGPQGRAEEDGEIVRYQIIGRDMVALDASGARLFGMDPDEVGHIRLAAEMGGGVADLSKLRVHRITLEG